MHFSSFCTTNYVPLERFGYNLHETVSLKPLGLFFFLLAKSIEKSFSEKYTLNSLRTTNILHSFYLTCKRAFILGKLPNKSAPPQWETFQWNISTMPASSSILAFLRVRPIIEVRILWRGVDLIWFFFGVNLVLLDFNHHREETDVSCWMLFSLPIGGVEFCVPIAMRGRPLKSFPNFLSSGAQYLITCPRQGEPILTLL